MNYLNHLVAGNNYSEESILAADNLIGNILNTFQTLRKRANPKISKGMITRQTRREEYKSIYIDWSQFTDEFLRNAKTTKNPLYQIWISLKTRCYNQNCDSYENYGGRGITVCQEWLDDFKNFSNYIMDTLGRKVITSDSINRINNDGNYEPGNVEWSTKHRQARNRNNVVSEAKAICFAYIYKNYKVTYVELKTINNLIFEGNPSELIAKNYIIGQACKTYGELV